MEYEIITQPYMLQETVAMLYRYVNGISFREVLSRKKFFAGNDVTDSMVRRMNRLQQIMEEACADIDPKDPLFLRFFANADAASEGICIALLMTYSFCKVGFPGLRENAAEICAFLHNAQNENKWLDAQNQNTLVFVDRAGSPGDLFEQVCSLPYSSDFQIKLYRALRSFDQTMDELVELIAPVAARLEQLYQKDCWLCGEFEQYWQEVFTRNAPKEVARDILGYDETPGIPGKTFVLPLFMNCTFVAFGVNQLVDEPYNLLMLGSGATVNSHLRQRGNDLDGISAILKVLADRRRLEVLYRLGRGRSYCHELAEAMDMDSGNMSRHLALLNNYGFLHQEREATINYYEMDRDTLCDFLRLVQEILVP